MKNYILLGITVVFFGSHPAEAQVDFSGVRGNTSQAEAIAWWKQKKIDCNLRSDLAYNDWVAMGSPCYAEQSNSSKSGPLTRAGTVTGFGLAGAVFGSFFGNNPGKSAAVGALLAGGSFLALNVMITAEGHSTLSNSIAGGISGLLVGTGIGLTTAKPKDNIVQDAVAGTVVGAALGFVVSPLGTNEKFINSPIGEFLTHIEFIASHKELVLGIRW